MKRIAALGVCVFLLGTVPAAAQSYPGEEVTVNPGALGSGYLLYPGGKYGRHVGHLLQPGERRGAIRLHMPLKHAALPRKHHVAAATPSDAAPLPAPTTPPPPRHVARATPPPRPAAPAPSTDISSMPEDSAARLVAGGTVTTPQPVARPATPPPQKPVPAPPGAAAIPFTFGGPAAPVAPAPPPHRAASATPPPARTAPPPAAGLKRASTIPFAAGESSPASADVNAIHTLATTLNAALGAGAQKVQLEAYGGPRGDKSSDSRRLSLKRALVVRELLIEDGVPSEKIDVRAMGGADDSGAADRVDVFLRS